MSRELISQEERDFYQYYATMMEPWDGPASILYKDAPMIIMDEPTAALDALAEAEIYESFSSLVEGKTAIYISHRLASTKFCDKIALFDKDGVKEYGTHEELMEKQGLYYDMFVVQGKYYQIVSNEL